jgi:hypothetical protein
MTLRAAVKAARLADDAYAETLRHGVPGAAIEAARLADEAFDAAIRRNHGPSASRWDNLPPNEEVDEALIAKILADDAVSAAIEAARRARAEAEAAVGAALVGGAS